MFLGKNSLSKNVDLRVHAHTGPYRENREITVNWELPRRAMPRDLRASSTFAALLFIWEVEESKLAPYSEIFSSLLLHFLFFFLEVLSPKFAFLTLEATLVCSWVAFLASIRPRVFFDVV